MRGRFWKLKERGNRSTLVASTQLSVSMRVPPIGGDWFGFGCGPLVLVEK